MGGGRVRAGLRILLREEGVTFQRLKTWKASKDPRYAVKKARIEQLYAIAGVAGVGHVIAEAGEELAEPEQVSVDVDADLSRTQVHPAARCDSS